MRLKIEKLLFVQEINGFNAILPDGVDYVSPNIFALLLSQRYPRLSFAQIYEREGSNVVLEDKDGLLTIKSVTP